MVIHFRCRSDPRQRGASAHPIRWSAPQYTGEFESGLVASWFGAVASVMIGGIGSLMVAAVWMGLFPALRKVDRFEPADDKKNA